jgi:hypothetical protein
VRQTPGPNSPAVFRRTREAYLEHENAKAERKWLMPQDAKKAPHGIRAKRSKSGAVRFLFDVLSSDDPPCTGSVNRRRDHHQWLDEGIGRQRAFGWHD